MENLWLIHITIFIALWDKHKLPFLVQQVSFINATKYVKIVTHHQLLDEPIFQSIPGMW